MTAFHAAVSNYRYAARLALFAKIQILGQHCFFVFVVDPVEPWERQPPEDIRPDECSAHSSAVYLHLECAAVPEFMEFLGRVF